MGKLYGLWRVFKAGEQVANPALWKTGQITINGLSALFLAIIGAASAFGYDIPATPEQIDSIGLGVLALFNIVFTIVTSKTIGMPPRPSNPDTTETGNGNPAPPKWGDDSNQL